MKKEKFQEEIISGYSFSGPSIILGTAKYGGEVLKEHFVRIPLKTLNRHGLIAGATGTGKTKTLQIIAEQLSAQGVPCLLMDIKGDLSGVAARAQNNPKLQERHEKIGFPYIPDNSPVEFLSLSNEKGARLRATVSEFGPVLFSKILGLNDTQGSIVSLIFKYCDDHQLPLLDLRDVKKVIQYISEEGKDEVNREYGRVATTSLGAISRKIIELEQQGADKFFGELSFEVDDLCRITEDGKGVLSIIRLTDIQDRPKLFSTFMLQLMAEVYATFPEVGDPEKPKLCIFIDEAHLIFQEASAALLSQINTVIKLIRSKGIGIFFITQTPTDVPDSVLGQLGLKVQHALRAFTAKDRRAIKQASENFPLTDHYKVDQLLTELGIGEAIVTALNERGVPTPLVHCYLRAPQSRMDILSVEEIDAIIDQSSLSRKYNQKVDRESAYEILAAKLEAAMEAEVQEKNRKEMSNVPRSTRAPAAGRRAQTKSTFEKMVDNRTTRTIGNTIAREVSRGLLGMLGFNPSGRRSSSRGKSGWF